MKFLKITLLSIILLGSTTACREEFFQEARQQTNLATDTWGSTVDLERLIAGAYYGMSGYEGFRGLHGLQMAHEALMSDQAFLHTIGVGDDYQPDVYNRKNSRNDISLYGNIWRPSYQALSLANEILGWVEKNGPFKDQYGPVWTDRILGEARFIRSFIFFTLVRLHAPAYGANNSAPSILLVTKPSKEPFANPGRATVQQVYDQILLDLEQAVKLLPETYNAQTDPFEYQDRATRDAARFLLMRVHLQMKNFAKAKEQADILISSGRYPLTDDPIEAWNKTGVSTVPTGKARETVWQYVQYSTAQQQWKSSPIGSCLGFTARGNNNINTNRTLSASDAFTNAVSWTPASYTITALPANRPPAVQPNANNFVLQARDKRLAQLWRAIPAGFDPRTEYTSYTRTYLWCNKWNRTPTGNNNLYSLPMMRIAEVFLTRSIIRFKDGDRAGAVADLNVVRQRAGLPALTAAALTEDEIHQERMRELAFEDDRLYYLQALSLPIPPGDRTGEQPLDWKSDKFAMPIPNIEADFNPNAR